MFETNSKLQQKNINNAKHFTKKSILNQVHRKIYELCELAGAIEKKDIENIKEEIADNIVLDMQFSKFVYDEIFLRSTGRSMYNHVDEIFEIVEQKINRTEKRIKEGYYENN